MLAAGSRLRETARSLPVPGTTSRTAARLYSFVSKGLSRGNRMTSAGLRSLFRHHWETTGVTKANPHRFRHTFASDMLRAGISLPAFMQLMGHAQIQTTMVYFNSLHKTSGSNTLAPFPSASGPFRRRNHETKTYPAPHAPSDGILPASGGICDDFCWGMHPSPPIAEQFTLFLTYLGGQYPEVHSLNQLRAAILTSLAGWLCCGRINPPLAAITTRELW